MSRQYDWSQPLSEEEEQFLITQGREVEVRNHRVAMGQDPNTMPTLTGNEPGRGTDVPAGVGVIAPGLSPAHLGLRADGENFAHITTEQLEQELQRRYDAEKSTAADDSGEIQAASSGYVAETDDRPYEDWRAEELKAQAGYRELPRSGTKPEIIGRLREYDESDEEE